MLNLDQSEKTGEAYGTKAFEWMVAALDCLSSAVVGILLMAAFGNYR